jgi:hypothetical protein
MMGVIFCCSEGGNEEDKTPTISRERQCYGIKDWDILERRAFEHYMVKVWLKVCLIAH